MVENYNQLNLTYSITDKESKSVRLMCVFLVLIFAFVPLAEIVTDFDYYHITYQTNSFTCLVGWDFEPLMFKSLD